MNKDEISLISVRVLGLYLIAKGILALPDLYALINLVGAEGYEDLVYVDYAAAILAPLVLGLLFIFFSLPIAKWLSGRSASNVSTESASLPEIQSIAFSVLGLFIIFISGPRLLSTIISINKSNSFTDQPVGYFEAPIFLTSFSGVILGILLFIGARFWVNLYRWFREFGLEKKTSNQDAQ